MHTLFLNPYIYWNVKSLHNRCIAYRFGHYFTFQFFCYSWWTQLYVHIHHSKTLVYPKCMENLSILNDQLEFDQLQCWNLMKDFMYLKVDVKLDILLMNNKIRSKHGLFKDSRYHVCMCNFIIRSHHRSPECCCIIWRHLCTSQNFDGRYVLTCFSWGGKF